MSERERAREGVSNAPAALAHLWADWRGAYIAQATADERADAAAGVVPEAGERCVFCRILATAASDEEANIVWRGEYVFAILNAYHYTSGHLMVMPLRHTGDLTELTAAEHAELWDAVTTATATVRRAYGAEGINLGVNLGRAAGAGIPGHLHVHVVPRWNGDTNFMTAVANTRVLPEALPATRARLAAAWGPSGAGA